MPKKEDIASITTKIFNLLINLESDERKRVVNAALTLLGEPLSQHDSAENGESNENASHAGELSDAKTFFHQKEPKTKMEELAVAARYRELKLSEQVHDKNNLEEVFTKARINFDTHNFKRDLSNAKIKGFFIKGREIKLAYYGQQFVDTLPDREATKQLKKPRTKKKSIGKKKTRKK
ncbi:MAG: hypothetical protein ACFFCD_17935 [Promethearchaeota archaeon]